jgi:hypothetical protein
VVTIGFCATSFPNRNHFPGFPFAATIEGNQFPAAAVIFRKVFDYGTVIWLARGIGIVRAGSTVAAALFVLEWVQRYLPGREPETTDTVLALLITGILSGAGHRLLWPAQAAERPCSPSGHAEQATRNDGPPH